MKFNMYENDHECMIGLNIISKGSCATCSGPENDISDSEFSCLMTSVSIYAPIRDKKKLFCQREVYCLEVLQGSRYRLKN